MDIYPLLSTTERLYFFCKGRVYYAYHSNIDRAVKIGDLPFVYRALFVILSFSVICRTSLRLIPGAFCIADGFFYLFWRGSLYRGNISRFSKMKRVLRLKNGNGPLRICRTQHNALFFGEYFLNKHRSQPVSIYKTTDGINWTSVYQFKAGVIRHIHGIYDDPNENGLWILTGDSDAESAIWFADYDFKNISKRYSKGQLTRAVSLHVSKDYLLYPTDSPLSKNYLVKITKKNGHFLIIDNLRSSSFDIQVVNDTVMFSTVAEPSLLPCR